MVCIQTEGRRDVSKQDAYAKKVEAWDDIRDALESERETLGAALKSARVRFQ